MTWDILRLFQTANKIEALEQCQIATYKSNVILVEGASRSGKTNKAKYGELNCFNCSSMYEGRNCGKSQKVTTLHV